MARITTYTCDRCGKTTAPGDLFEVGVKFGFIDVAHRPDRKADWCRDCLAMVAGWEPATPGLKKLDPPPTMEDLVREIIRQDREGA